METFIEEPHLLMPYCLLQHCFQATANASFSQELSALLLLIMLLQEIIAVQGTHSV